MSARGGSIDEPLLERQNNAQAPTQSGSADSSMDLAGNLEPFFIPGTQAPLQHGPSFGQDYPASLRNHTSIPQTRCPPKVIQLVPIRLLSVVPLLMACIFDMWSKSCPSEYGCSRSYIRQALFFVCFLLAALPFFMSPLKHFYLDVCFPPIQRMFEACCCIPELSHASVAKFLQPGDLIQAGTRLYEARVLPSGGEAPSQNLSFLVPDHSDPRALDRQVRNLRGLRNRTTDGLPWVLECGFLIYAVIDVPGDHMEELQQVIQRKLCDSSVHEAHMRRYRHTWQRVLTLLSLPSDVSSHERERLEKGDLCQRVHVNVSYNMPSYGSVHDLFESRKYKAFVNWRSQILLAVRAGACEWCRRHAAYHYIDSGSSPWSLLLRGGWNPSAGWSLLVPQEQV